MIARTIIFHKDKAYNLPATKARVYDFDRPEHRYHMHTTMIDFTQKILEDATYASLIDFDTMIPDPNSNGRQMTTLSMFLVFFGVQDLTVEWYNGNNNATDDSTIDTFTVNDDDMDDELTITTTEEDHLVEGVQLLNSLRHFEGEVNDLIDNYYAEQEEKEEDDMIADHYDL